METISEYAFFDCTALKTVTIGSGVTTIGECAFFGCTSLTTVYYNGTKSEWAAISISSIDDYYLTQATIICSDGTY